MLCQQEQRAVEQLPVRFLALGLSRNGKSVAELVRGSRGDFTDCAA